jgi:hypothetical protein
VWGNEVIPRDCRRAGEEMSGSDGTVRQLRVTSGERLVRWNTAASTVGVSADGLMDWYRKGWVPAVRSPGLWMVYHSWIQAVLSAARPGQAADIPEIARAWWEARLPDVPPEAKVA